MDLTNSEAQSFMTPSGKHPSSDHVIRIGVDGKFFRSQGSIHRILGVTYGPFPPDSGGNNFLSEQETRQDFKNMVELGVNAFRVYTIPPGWLIELAGEFGLRIMVDIPWNPHQAFLETRASRNMILKELRNAAMFLQAYPQIFAISIANEIPSQVIRWQGRSSMEKFLETACDSVKQAAPETLVTFANYPSTEYLHPAGFDFSTCNVYLHDPDAFTAYLNRIQHRCGATPLVLGEIGMDTLREGEIHQANFLETHLKRALQEGVAGCFVFSWTDLWWRNGFLVEDWQFGLTDVDRRLKPGFYSVQSVFRNSFPSMDEGEIFPQISIVVASYNGEKHLRSCLSSLENLDYPNYEVLLIDDGSTDSTSELAKEFPSVRYLRQDRAGLSAARNLGIQESQGNWIAFTDDDCVAPREWLKQAVSGKQGKPWDGVGGPNFIPASDGPVANAIHLSPGAPTHVLLTDEIAEHIPGCNMIFNKSALQSVGGFNTIFRTAGDDVDVCWRLQEAGYQIGFVGAAYVWHHRRDSISGYFKQQAGYGRAEAALERAHPNLFDSLGRSRWKGSVYEGGGAWNPDQKGPIYGGPFGSAGFQLVYQGLRQRSWNPFLHHQFETWLLIHIPLWILGIAFPILFLCSAGLAVFHFYKDWKSAPIRLIPQRNKHWWSRPLISALRFAHPLVRGFSRYLERWKLSRLTGRANWKGDSDSLDEPKVEESHKVFANYWSFHSHLDPTPNRFDFLSNFQNVWSAKQGVSQVDDGWREQDLIVIGDFWMEFKLNTLVELGDYPGGILRIKIQPALRPSAIYGILILLSAFVSCVCKAPQQALFISGIFWGLLTGVSVFLKMRQLFWKKNLLRAIELTIKNR